MTAAQEQAPKLPFRTFVRIAWVGHRALYRFSGGGFQAQPDTTVELKDGPRAVRGRVAVGAERERLWASFRDYPGWGDDLDALAARRATERAVVVLEPRTAAAIAG